MAPTRRALAILFTLAGSLGLSSSAPGGEEDERRLLFSYFKGNGEDGLHLATTGDGLKWTPLKSDEPFLAPRVGESKLMRDPSITRGPDGTFHMVWTTSWKGQTIGYAHSRDLIEWSEQKALPVMAHEPTRINCWAPEIFYDAASAQFYVVWATTIPGRFPQTAKSGDGGYNHRLYSITTRDFKTVSRTKLYYDPEINVIDGTIAWDAAQKRYAMVVKNETRHPPAKNLFMTFAKKLSGPWSPPSKPFSGPEWAEGPSLIQVGDTWYCYWDKYRKGRYGAATSKDLVEWTDISAKVRFPQGARHGTVFRAPKATIERLKKL